MFFRTISRRDLRNGCERELDAYINGTGNYLEIAQACQDARQRDITMRVATIPGTYLFLNATLDTLLQPQVQRRLDTEVNERQLQAIRCVNRVTRLIGRPGTLRQLERANKELYGGTGWSTPLSRRIHKVNELAAAPFIDYCLIGGGALRALKQANIELPDYAEIITRSSILPFFARIDQARNMKAARTYLGTPYAGAENYVVNQTSDSIAIGFAPEAKAVLKSYMTPRSGCPAHRMRVTDATTERPANLFMLQIPKLTQYMIPEGAAASDHQPAYF